MQIKSGYKFAFPLLQMSWTPFPMFIDHFYVEPLVNSPVQDSC